jgi:hypothetical protein
MHSVEHPHPSRQRGPHNDPHLLDGDSAHGTSDVEAGDEWAVDTDTDVLDDAAADPLEEAVADPLPETEEDLEAFTAGVDRDTPADEPPVAERAGLDDTDDEPDGDDELDGETEDIAIDATDVDAEGEEEDASEEEDEDEDEGADDADIAAADEDDANEVDEADDRGAELDDADLETAAVGEGTTAEAEVDRQMAVTSVPPAEPARPAKRGRTEPVGRPPMEDYLTLTVPQVLERAAGLDAGEVARVLEFEQANRNRKTLVAKLSKLTRSE